MSATAPLKDRIQAEYSTLLDNFGNLIKSARIAEEQTDTRMQTRIPGELIEVFAEKMINSTRSLLAMIRELKHLVLLNSVEDRNAEVASSRADLECKVAEIEARLAEAATMKQQGQEEPAGGGGGTAGSQL